MTPPPLQQRKNGDSNNNALPEPEGAIHSGWSHRPEQGPQQDSEDKSANRRKTHGSDSHKSIFHMEGSKLLGETLIVA
jgi:hypothetical protein